MSRNREKGVALVFTLILVTAVTVMGVSLAFIARSDAFASMNYRLMSQARDAAEAGINKAANHLMFSYTKPNGTAANTYTRNVTPVTHSGSPVVLSARPGVSSNYPVSGDQTAFNSAAHGTLTAGNTTVTYAASARLLSMEVFTPFGKPANSGVVQTWEITSDGTISGIQNAAVQVSAILEQPKAPVFTYAAFATFDGCEALRFGGGGSTGSYDSANTGAGTQAYGGNVGTNGNLSTSGSPTTINGSLSTPRSGVGDCDTNNVTAWTANQGTVTEGIIELPQEIVYPTPDIPSPGTTDLTTNQTNGCTTGAGQVAGCRFVAGGHMVLDAASVGGTINARNITLTGNRDLYLTPGTYNINSIVQNGNTTLHIICSVSPWNTSPCGPVILNVTGTGVTTPILLTGGGISNPSLDPTNLQILYAGTGNVRLKGGANASALLYAPNADIAFNSSGGTWYGAVIGKTLSDMGGAAIYYDRQLEHKAYREGEYQLGSFSWKKF